ncbi:MAG: glycine cleavage system protein GcvH [Candidatus Omnitrophica bacterium]|nr:glycine cleavage system protein GcvH [Candidatus Omnitrophota bacterium]
MQIPDRLFYTKEHEWVRLEKDVATIGITDYAQGSLGDITFVDVPKAGASAKQFKPLAAIESVKAASDIYAPVSGEIIKANSELTAHPELINSSPYDKGWIAVIRPLDVSEKKNLMNPADYTKYVEGLSK